MLPKLCSKCKKLKDPSLGQMVRVRGRMHDQRFICDHCTSLPKFESGRRSEESPLEKKCRLTLQDMGVRFSTQKPIGKFIFDFCIIPLRLLIETDGNSYHSHPSRKARDRRKDALARSEGWHVCRIRNGPDLQARIEKAVLERQQALSLDPSLERPSP